MSQALSSNPRHFRRYVAGLPGGVLEILVLAPLAAILVLGVIPAAFEIEWSCVGEHGVRSTGGDSYVDALGVAGTFGWLLVIVGVLFAHISERPRVAALLPLAWFVALVLVALVVAALIGPQPC
ncbi:MAG TPA: hypothetical protein VI409_12840 [Gaiellaceae bacterium]|nr:hypothetical protein [Gaiellaceae bacterium]